MLEHDKTLSSANKPLNVKIKHKQNSFKSSRLENFKLCNLFHSLLISLTLLAATTVFATHLFDQISVAIWYRRSLKIHYHG